MHLLRYIFSLQVMRNILLFRKHQYYDQNFLYEFCNHLCHDKLMRKWKYYY